mmetsp:Transcript_77439/g.185623  ORF Transcript_77439/g.185623 Transcript_77439/m.185623 type:complete len:295 (-) Transcript_77439:581-1465(-)
MHHDHDADGALGEAPRVLVGEIELFAAGVLGVLEGDVEHLGEVLSQMVRRRSLNRSPGGRNEGLHGGGVVGAREGLRLGLGTPYHGNGEELLIDAGIQLQNCQDLFFCRGLLCIGCMTFLPEELPGAQEGRGLLHLPSDHAAPLVQPDGQVPVRLDPVGVCRVHGGLAGWPDGHGLIDLLVAELGDHRELRGKVVQVVAFLLHVALRDEHWEVAVLYPQELDLAVKPPLDLLPEFVRPGPQDEAAFHWVLLDKLTFPDHLCVPLRDVLGLLVHHATALGLLLLVNFSRLLRLGI